MYLIIVHIQIWLVETMKYTWNIYFMGNVYFMVFTSHETIVWLLKMWDIGHKITFMAHLKGDSRQNAT